MSASLHDLTELRLQLLANGYLPIPVTSPKANDDQYGKRPALKGWADIKRLDAAEVRNWTQLFPSACNTGILCGAIAAVDIDVDDEAVVEKILSAASEILGSGAPVRIGRAPRALLVYRTATPLRKQCSDEFVLPSGLLAKVEVLGEGQQFVAEGIHPSTRQPYRWLGASLADIRFDELPEIDEAKLGSFLDRVNRLMLDAGLERRETIFKNEAEGRRIACQLDGPVDPAVVVDALSHIPNEDAHYDFWLRMGFSLHHGLDEDGFTLWDEWSSKSVKYDAAFTKKTWSGFKREGGVTIGTLFYIAKHYGWRRKGGNDRPMILVMKGELHNTVDQAETALLDSSIEIFKRGDTLVRLISEPIDIGGGKTVPNVRLTQVTEPWLTETLMRVAAFRRIKIDTGEPIPIDCPNNVAWTYLDRLGDWRLPALKTLVQGPVLRSDGSVIAKPGYDPVTGFYAAFDADAFPPLPERPDRAAAERALGQLEGLLSTFPFASDADRSVAVAAILTGLCRHLLPTAPIFGFSASVAGSGKSLLVDLTSIVVTGRPAAVLAPGKTEEELEKRLGAAFIQGSAVLSIDNCVDGLGGAFLCQVLSQRMVKTRLLGQSKIVEVPTTALMMATGNNLTFVEDMTRRALVCTLAPEEERPEEREFTNDVMQEALSRRGELCIAGLTVLRAFMLSGQSGDSKEQAFFPEWSRLVRAALLWLRRADPRDTIENIREKDPVLENTLALLHQLDEHFGSRPFSVAELIEDAAAQHNSGSGSVRYLYRDLHQAVAAFCGGRDDLNPVSIGKALSRLEGRSCNGLKLIRSAKRGGKVMWQIKGGREKGIADVI